MALPATSSIGGSADLSKMIQEALHALMHTLVQSVEDVLQTKVLAPYLEKLEALEKRLWRQELTIHRLLEKEEEKRNKENYSDVIIYKLKENPSIGDRELATRAISKLNTSENEVPSMSMLSEASDMILETRRLPIDPRPGEPKPLLISHYAMQRCASR